MDEITEDDISPQTGREPTSPLSPKRPRTDCSVTNDHSGESRFDFPELLTFRKTISSSSSGSTLPKNEARINTAECGDFQHEKPHEQPQDTTLNVTPITRVTTSHGNSAHTGSSKVCFITAERHLLLQGKEEQPAVSETDKSSLYPGDDTGGSLAESPASANADTPSHPDCKRLGKSLEDKTSGDCSLSAGHDKDGRQVQNCVSQIQAVTLSSRIEEVRCQSDCTYKDVDTAFCDTWSRFREGVKTNQKKDELEFSEHILISKEEDKSLISSSDYADFKPLDSNPEEEPSGNLAEGGKKEKYELESQICEKENVFVCDGETKGQVNENGMSKTVVPSAAECAEESVLSYDVVLDRNMEIKNGSLEVDDFCGAKGEDAAGKIIAKAGNETADHTTETPMPARISQEPAEGDNDAGPFSVIDPAIWSEADREAEEKRCNSESTAGVELSPSVTACEMETPLPLCSDFRTSQKVSSPDQTEQLNHQSRPQQDKDVNEDCCLSYTEPHARSITTSETHDKTDNEGNCQSKSSPSSSPAKPLPAGDDGLQESHDTVAHQLKEQSPSGCFAVSLDHLNTQEVEYSQSEIDRMGKTTEIKEREGIAGFVKEKESDEHGESEVTDKLQNEQHKDDTTEISTSDCISGWTEGERHERESKPIEGELEKKLECLSDQPFSADISTMDVTAEETERKEVSNVEEEIKTDGHENSETLVKSGEDVQQQSEPKVDTTEVSSGEGMSDWTEGNKLTLGSEDDKEHNLSCFSDCRHTAELSMAGNKGDLLALTSPSTSGAVVPCQLDLSYSQNTHNNPTALNCSDRWSLSPSAFTLYNRVPGGFDTFEKIQLSPDDDDAAGLSNIPVLTSSPRQLLETCEPVAESDKHEEIPEEEEEDELEEQGGEEVERFECHTENTANGFLSSDSACNELPNFISAADVIAIGWPEQLPNCESAYDSCEHIQDELHPESASPNVATKTDNPASDVNDCSEFGMKKQFDMVLRELNLFFDISRNDFAGDCRPSSPEQCSDTTEPLEGNTLKCEERLSSPELGRHSDTSSDDAGENRSLEMCGGDPVVSRTAVSSDGEQEVPFSRHLCQETSIDTTETHREPREMEQKGKMWSPSFVCLPLLEQLSHRPPEQHRRLEPLKTCTRPIRVGLSKRAKTKHLHRPHPYR